MSRFFPRPVRHGPSGRAPVVVGIGDSHQPLMGIAQVMLAAAMWGTVGVATQAVTAASALPDAVFGIARMMLGGPLIILLVILAKQGTLASILRLDSTRLAAFAIGCAVFQVSLFRAFALLGVTEAVFLTVCLPPVLGCGWALIRKTQPLSRGATAALSLAVAGIGAFGWGSVSGDPQGAFTGLAFAIVAAVAFVVMTTAARDLTRSCGPLIVVGTGLTLSGALLVVALPVTGAQGMSFAVLGDWQVLGLLLYLGLAPTALAYVAYCAGVARCRSANIGLIATMVEPAVAAVLAWFLLQERLLPGELAGCCLVTFAMLVLWRSECGDKTVRAREAVVAGLIPSESADMSGTRDVSLISPVDASLLGFARLPGPLPGAASSRCAMQRGDPALSEEV